jgi:GNAT superfamily N-acetyltransferase
VTPDDVGRRLLAALPDEPRWVEVRGMLRVPWSSVVAAAIHPPAFVVRVLGEALSAVGVVGLPPREAIVGGLAGATPMTPIIAQLDNASHVERCLSSDAEGRWAGERAIVHRLRGDSPLAPAAPPMSAASAHDPSAHAERVSVRLLRGEDALSHLPEGLRHEMTYARRLGPVGVALMDGVPASFCYAVWETETLWDVSVDTLEAFRGRALAERTVRFMVEHHRGRGLEPVWGALVSNGPSLRLAARLGFEPVDAVMVFSRGPWAFLTAGFDHG